MTYQRNSLGKNIRVIIETNLKMNLKKISNGRNKKNGINYLSIEFLFLDNVDPMNQPAVLHVTN